MGSYGWNNPQESHPSTPARYHGYTFNVTPNCPLTYKKWWCSPPDKMGGLLIVHNPRSDSHRSSLTVRISLHDRGCWSTQFCRGLIYQEWIRIPVIFQVRWPFPFKRYFWPWHITVTNPQWKFHQHTSYVFPQMLAAKRKVCVVFFQKSKLMAHLSWYPWNLQQKPMWSQIRYLQDTRLTAKTI